MKKILSILFLLITFYSFGQTPTYSPNRSKGNVIVTDVALRAKDFLQLPYANAASPSIGSYADSTGWVMYNRYDSTIIVRNAGTWFKFYNSIKINAMDALNAHLAGSETFTGAKTFNGNIISAGTTTVGNDIIWNNNTGYGLKAQDGTRYLSYTPTFGAYMPKLMLGNQVNLAGAPQLAVTGKIRATDSIISQTGIRLTNDLVWNTDGGFGLRGSDGVRHFYYTTALGNVATTLRVGGTTIQNGNPQLTVQGKAFITDSLNGANANFSGTTRTSKIIGNSSTPSISGGSASFIGTGASTSVVGNDMAGVATLITGTGCSSTGASNRSAFSVTFSSAYATAPVVIISAIQKGGLVSTDGPSMNFFLRSDAVGTSGFTVYLPIGVTLTDSTTYEITYHVIGK